MRTRISLAALALAASLGCRCQPRSSPVPAGDGGTAAADGGAGPPLAGSPRLEVDGGLPAVTFVEAEGDPPDLPVRFTCSAAGHDVRLGIDGRGSWRRPGGEPRPFALPLVDAGDVALVRCAFPEEALLLVVGLADERSTWGEVARLSGEPPAVRWVAHLPGFPSADPLLAGRHLFVGASGFAGKLDVEDGRWEWSHRGLEDAEYPGRPRVEGGVAAFPDASGGELWLDEETGVRVPPSADGGPLASGSPGAADAAAARRLVALARAALPGVSWQPSTFLSLDLDGDDETDHAIAGVGPELLAVVVSRGPISRGEIEWIVVHSTRAPEASLRPERLRPPPSTLVCPAGDDPGTRSPAAEANRAACEAYQRRRARLAELDERGVRGLVLLPAGVHLLVDPATGRLAHWRSEP